MFRAAAALIAAVTWAGLAIQFSATYAGHGSAAETLWVLLRYFTIITNLLVAALMTLIAVGRRVSTFALGGVTLAILLVGVVYMLLLRGLVALEGAALLADRLLHYAVPLLMTAFWLASGPKGRLRWRDPLLWSLYPLAYFGYALLRGATDGKYPYPFMNVGEIGAAQTALNAAAMAGAFMVAGWALVGIDRWLRRVPRLAQTRTTGEDIIER
ncbi:MAG: Pr6Pr family membrane protein [Sphingomonas sp.]|nr:Pr6Pr family membrane protein [Sphingomonas sp.]